MMGINHNIYIYNLSLAYAYSLHFIYMVSVRKNCNKAETYSFLQRNMVLAFEARLLKW